MSQQIIIEVGLEGGVQVTAKGFKGKSCKDATAQIEKALGRTTSDNPTSEMHQVETVKNTN